MTQTEWSSFPEGHRSNIHVFVGAGGFIAVPADPVTAILVEIVQYNIKFNIGMLLHTLADLKQFCGQSGSALRSGLLVSLYHVVILRAEL
jgi:hypothetical protein